jgi:hypothetical protein
MKAEYKIYVKLICEFDKKNKIELFTMKLMCVPSAVLLPAAIAFRFL